MEYTKVKNYTDKEILTRCEELGLDLDELIGKYWVVGIRSKEDTFNVFDDKFYLFSGRTNLSVMTGTTNAGKPALFGGYKKYNKKGVAIIKSDQIMKDCFTYGLHKGKMPCLRQCKNIFYYRDNNNDNKIDEKGTLYVGNYNTNLHANTYNFKNIIKRWFIGGWSYGCMVINDIPKYVEMINIFKEKKQNNVQKYVTIVLLNEF